jgi:hypothetical protein
MMLFVGACRSGATPTPEPTATTAARVTSTPTFTLTPIPSETPTPFTFPARAEAREPVCEGAPVSRMILQARGRVTNEDERPLRMRSEPGTQNAIVATLAVGDVFLVLEGPQCAQSYSWYKIRFEGEEGWVAEGDRRVYYIEPYLPG